MGAQLQTGLDGVSQSTMKSGGKGWELHGVSTALSVQCSIQAIYSSKVLALRSLHCTLDIP